MLNDTMTRFGFPDSVISEYDHWVVQLRPKQVTLGSLVLICKEEATMFSAITQTAATELHHVVRDIEEVLGNLFSYDKINYLMLMMVDPHVHFHVIPRYETSRFFDDKEWKDANWPGPADVKSTLDMSEDTMQLLQKTLKSKW